VLADFTGSAPPSCMTCRHWIAPDQPGGDGAGNVDAGDARKGVCRRISVDLPSATEVADDLLAHAQNQRDASSCLRTAPGFGCVMHEPVVEAAPSADAVEQDQVRRSVRRIVTLSDGYRAELAVASFRLSDGGWAQPRFLRDDYAALSMEDVALVAAVARELFASYAFAFGEKL